MPCVFLNFENFKENGNARSEMIRRDVHGKILISVTISRSEQNLYDQITRTWTL